ncbi:FAD/NAD(P)-binding domain-containing protein [Calocera viscosa TUFC12733]|uniref:FAD/NAD(P)-binding domain-containing protein n=1 Tax=Calocera viscosa (strain TUFC12733) TaxID=1330018 RepID=A0A167JDL9_CALVF|nr:FAD/NAD(P)-binding domain-containing protein [Calocera viscosa TUFC12733]
MADSQKKKVLIIGAGVAGPLLALVLQHKGFEPVIYERHKENPPGGLAMQLSGQSLKVLNLLGLAEGALALALPLEHAKHRSELTGRVFLDAPAGAGIRAATGWPLCTVIRATYGAYLLDAVKQRGIELHWGKKFVGLREEGEKVIAEFVDGSEAEGDLLVGCDGIHSTVRDVLFGKTPAEFTGLVGIAGYTPFTEKLHPSPPMTVEQVWGDGCHYICLPLRQERYMWAVNMPEDTPGMLEDWRTVRPATDEQVGKMLKALPCYDWGGGVGDVIKGTTELIKFGLYIRPIAPVWHKGRAVLLGDAAHPTTPFLGQGANQSTEDVYHLVRCLLQHAPLTSESLDKAFTEYAAVRMDRVRRTIEQTKAEGDLRRISGREACLAREEVLARGMGTDTWKIILEMVSGPFTGESEI